MPIAVVEQPDALAPDDAEHDGPRIQRDPERLRVTEIFLSLQGEARDVGWPTVFVRLTGCPLRCVYCDTAYSFYGGAWWTIEAIAAEVARLGARHVCVTGGEPLAQKRCLALLTRLCDAGHAVSLETSGALDIGAVDPRVSRVVDMKTPASGECARNRYANLALVGAHDQVKFVIADRADFDWSHALVVRERLCERTEVLFSPTYGAIEPRTLAEWILDAQVPVRFQLQLHKLLWGEAPGR